MSGPDPDWTLAAIKAQAEEVLRAAGGAHPSQQAEVLAMASVGRAGLALAHIVRHWFRQQEYEAKTALMRPQVLLIRGTMPDWLLERSRANLPSDVNEPTEPECPFDFAHTRHWCGYQGCRDA